jgi:predicted secreted hydrolase
MIRRLACLLLLCCTGCDREAPTGIDVAGALGGEADSGFARATQPRQFAFPADHNAHPAFRNEWWYITGHLQTPEGNRFGYQVTFFRIALAPEAAGQNSAWATRQLWMAHAALTDIGAADHRHAQRLAREALGLAGQQSEPFRLWLEDWSIEGSAGGAFPWQVQVKDDAFELALTLEPQREPVLQGVDGLSQKSAAPGNASYYYSITRLATAGTITRGGNTMTAIGTSWLDREWSTSALGDDQSGWDWFSLQLDSGADLMLYRLRDKAGATDPHSAGSFVDGDHRQLGLAANDFELQATRWWESPAGARYPVAWRLSVPGKGLDLRVEALVDDQEMLTGVHYWEGAVDVWSATSGKRLGQGYLEMTGYGS